MKRAASTTLLGIVLGVLLACGQESWATSWTYNGIVPEGTEYVVPLMKEMAPCAVRMDGGTMNFYVDPVPCPYGSLHLCTGVFNNDDRRPVYDIWIRSPVEDSALIDEVAHNVWEQCYNGDSGEYYGTATDPVTGKPYWAVYYQPAFDAYIASVRAEFKRRYRSVP